MKKYKLGFTLIEIIISVIISVIVLMFLFTIVSNVIEEVDYNNKQSNILSSYNDFFKKIE
jgi:prepilin-type N-terminal cleavage/methylation domain-containing protein